MKHFVPSLASAFVMLGLSVGCGSSNLNEVSSLAETVDMSTESSADQLEITLPRLERQSQEFRYRVSYVALSYRICMGREADRGGLSFWTNVIASGRASLEQVGLAICKNTETQLTEAYRDVLGRNPDQQGRRYWMAALSAYKVTIADVRWSLEASRERKVINLDANKARLQQQLARLEMQRARIAEALKKS